MKPSLESPHEKFRISPITTTGTTTLPTIQEDGDAIDLGGESAVAEREQKNGDSTGLLTLVAHSAHDETSAAAAPDDSLHHTAPLGTAFDCSSAIGLPYRISTMDLHCHSVAAVVPPLNALGPDQLRLAAQVSAVKFDNIQVGDILTRRSGFGPTDAVTAAGKGGHVWVITHSSQDYNIVSNCPFWSHFTPKHQNAYADFMQSRVRQYQLELHSWQSTTLKSVRDVYKSKNLDAYEVLNTAAQYLKQQYLAHTTWHKVVSAHKGELYDTNNNYCHVYTADKSPWYYRRVDALVESHPSAITALLEGNDMSACLQPNLVAAAAARAEILRQEAEDIRQDRHAQATTKAQTAMLDAHGSAVCAESSAASQATATAETLAKEALQVDIDAAAQQYAINNDLDAKLAAYNDPNVSAYLRSFDREKQDPELVPYNHKLLSATMDADKTPEDAAAATAAEPSWPYWSTPRTTEFTIILEALTVAVAAHENEPTAKPLNMKKIPASYFYAPITAAMKNAYLIELCGTTNPAVLPANIVSHSEQSFIRMVHSGYIFGGPNQNGCGLSRHAFAPEHINDQALPPNTSPSGADSTGGALAAEQYLVAVSYRRDIGYDGCGIEKLPSITTHELCSQYGPGYDGGCVDVFNIKLPDASAKAIAGSEETLQPLNGYLQRPDHGKRVYSLNSMNNGSTPLLSTGLFQTPPNPPTQPPSQQPLPPSTANTLATPGGGRK